MAQEKTQQLKLLIGEGGPFPVHGDGAAGEIHSDPLKAKDLPGLRPAAAAQHGADAGEEFHHAKGLCKVVVRPQVQGLDLIVLRSLGGGHHHRDGGEGGVGPHPPQELYPVDAREHDVHHHKVRTLPPDGFPEAAPIGKAPGGKPRGLQGVDLDIPDAAVVFHTPDHS